MGIKGESLMIALMKKNETQSKILTNNKAKECIVKAFALSNIENPNIDFVIETLFFTYGRESCPNVRKSALIALDILHKRSQDLQTQQSVDWADQSGTGRSLASTKSAKTHFNTYL